MTTSEHWITVNPVTYSPELDAVVFDTDGVITRTAAVHFSAWKAVFDRFLAAASAGESARPFSDADYRHYVDGVGRYDGVQRFLASRDIELPRGDPGDAPGNATICAVGNLKNDAFEDAVAEHGVEPYLTTRRFIEKLQAQGIRTAVISASENCEMVLRAAGMDDLFEVRVDGLDAARIGFPGKPEPDVFLEAARRLGVPPSNTAVVEDAISGVTAGRAGGFGLVIGLDRTRNPAPLAEYADIVVPDLADLSVDGRRIMLAEPARAAVADLPGPLGDHDLSRMLDRDEVAVFLDHDGTLAPIVDDPDDAALSDAARSALEDLARRVPVAIITGRDTDDFLAVADPPPVWVAGSHGFDVHSPEGERIHVGDGAAAVPALDAAELELADAIASTPGAWAERKAFGITVHHRATPRSDIPALARAVEAVADSHDELRLSGGKEILELRPTVEWHKGSAVGWLMQRFGFGPDALAVFLGDDVTDEDGFAAVRTTGIGVVVAAPGDTRESAAHYRLDGPDQVVTFLREVASLVD